ncbi:outer membrane protein [Dysgonomonas sp. PH5-45]|uniref:OmpH family outer membrane protein n=1 Tax=unclassified Dysgonomonas TaxID=2630389 RepID=UPI0024751641|nr:MULTISPECIES: OmpH family outer membrane protein [unclassified Dysgonomonas]MDH6354151.1 outer membrane protein [Dysgonomonas sp. PH5-45]MDH6386998.1 outer membrane protein [Dysgonomonas sp. PH5-37]
MLKKLIICLLIAMPFGVYAQEKLAYISTEEVFMAMPELKDVETKINAKQEEIKKIIGGIDAEFQKKQTEFRNDTTTLTPSIIADRQKQLEQIEERYQTYSQSSQKELQELYQTLQAPLLDKLRKAIQEVGLEQGYTYIIEKGTVPYVSTSAVDAGKLVKAKLGIK